MKKILVLSLVLISSLISSAQVVYTKNFFGSGTPAGIIRANAGVKYIDLDTRIMYIQNTIASGTSWSIVARDVLVTTDFLVQGSINFYARSAVDTIYRTPGKDSIQFKIGGVYHAILDSAGGSSLPAIAVDTLYRTPGKDSIQFTIGGNYYAILDSAGSASSLTAVDTLYRTPGKDSIQFTIGGNYYAILDSAGATAALAVDTIYRTDGKDSIQFTIGGVYHAILDSAGATAALAVDTIYRTDGKDSIQFTIGGVYHAILDSAGATAALAVDTIYRTPGKDSIQFTIGGAYHAILDSATAPGVTSVGLSLPASEFNVTGTPVTGAGTLTGAWLSQTRNLFFASPSGGTGTPSFRALVSGDIPALSYVTSVGMTVPTGLTVTGGPVTGAGTLAVTLTAGYVIPTTTEETNWNTAYTNRIVSLTTTGTSGAATLLSNVLNIPVYQAAGTYVTSVGMTVPTGLTVTGSPVTGAGTLAVTLTAGYVIPTTTDEANWNTAYTNRIASFTTSGSSGAASFSGNTLNVPNYSIAGLSPLSTKGDLFTFSTVNTRLAVGATDGQVLQVSSAAATGLAYSTPTYPSASGSSGAILRSNGTNNVYTTATYPTTTTVNRIFYSSATNTVGEITTANSSVLVTDGSGVPGLSTTIPAATLITPTIASFVNATHTHQNAAGGGTLDFTLIGGATIVPIANGGTAAATVAAARANLNVYNENLDMYSAMGSAIVAQSISPLVLVGVTGLVSQTVVFQAVWLPKAVTLNGVKWYQRTAGVYTANNYNGVGLYTYSAGTLTLVASSTTDGNIWKATSQTWSSKAFSGTYVASAGLYFVAALYCSSAQSTAPALGANAGNFTSMLTVDFTNSAKLSGTVASLTALPNPTQASSGITVAANNTYFGLY